MTTVRKSRRCFLSAAIGASLTLARSSRKADAATERASFTLGFSLYGMKDVPLADAVRHCATVGYDDVEPALMNGYETEPQSFDAAGRRKLRKLLASQGINVPALMDNLTAVATDEKHAENLERIRRAAELAHELSPEKPSLLETVLGGKPDEWEKLKRPMVERLGNWAEVARKHDILLAVKPHVSGALHLPEDAVWLAEQVASPNLRLVYDYSHYQMQDLPMEATLRKLAPHMAFVHIKDGVRRDGKVQFLLPGEGSTDYATLFRLLGELNYRGSVTVEVSSMIFKNPDYDPQAAAEKCYHSLAAAWNKEGLPSRKE